MKKNRNGPSTFEQAVYSLIRAALLAELPNVLAELRERERLISIKAAPIAYRAILDAERRGALKVYRIGKKSFVDAAELEVFIRREGAPQPVAAAEPVDEIDQLLAINRERQDKRSKR